jgi:hypothetical protein
VRGGPTNFQSLVRKADNQRWDYPLSIRVYPAKRFDDGIPDLVISVLSQQLKERGNRALSRSTLLSKPLNCLNSDFHHLAFQIMCFLPNRFLVQAGSLVG